MSKIYRGANKIFDSNDFLNKWSGTQTQYDEIEIKDENTLYFILENKEIKKIYKGEKEFPSSGGTTDYESLKNIPILYKDNKVINLEYNSFHDDYESETLVVNNTISEIVKDPDLALYKFGLEFADLQDKTVLIDEQEIQLKSSGIGYVYEVEETETYAKLKWSQSEQDALSIYLVKNSNTVDVQLISTLGTSQNVITLVVPTGRVDISPRYQDFFDTLDKNELTVGTILGDEIVEEYTGDIKKAYSSADVYNALKEIGGRLLLKFQSVLGVKDAVKYEVVDTYQDLLSIDMSVYSNGVYIFLVKQDSNYPRPGTSYYYSTIYAYIAYHETEDDIKTYDKYEWDLTQVNDEYCNGDYFFENDLALNCVADASSGVSSLGVDGNLNTRWESAQQDPQWYSVDLGDICTVSKIAFCWETAAASSYYIEFSMNGVNWTKVAYVSGAIISTKEYRQVTLQHECKTRFVRFYGESRITQYGYSFYEIGVYGKAAKGTLQFVGKTNADLVGLETEVATLNQKTKYYTEYEKEILPLYELDEYTVNRVSYFNAESNSYTKYGTEDGLKVLDPKDDPATYVLGGKYRTIKNIEADVFSGCYPIIDNEKKTVKIHQNFSQLKLQHFDSPTIGTMFAISTDTRDLSNGNISFTFAPQIGQTYKCAYAEIQTVEAGNLLLAGDENSLTGTLKIPVGLEKLHFRVIYRGTDMLGNEMTSETLAVNDPRIYTMNLKNIELPFSTLVGLETNPKYLGWLTSSPVIVPGEAYANKATYVTCDDAAISSASYDRYVGGAVLPVRDTPAEGYTEYTQYSTIPYTTFYVANDYLRNKKGEIIHFSFATTYNASGYLEHVYLKGEDEKLKIALDSDLVRIYTDSQGGAVPRILNNRTIIYDDKVFINKDNDENHLKIINNDDRYGCVDVSVGKYSNTAKIKLSSTVTDSSTIIEQSSMTLSSSGGVVALASGTAGSSIRVTSGSQSTNITESYVDSKAVYAAEAMRIPTMAPNILRDGNIWVV